MAKHQGRPWGDPSPKSTAAWRRRQDAVADRLERHLERGRKAQPYRRQRLAVDLENA